MKSKICINRDKDFEIGNLTVNSSSTKVSFPIFVSSIVYKKTCEKLEHESESGQPLILAVGETKTHIILITRDYYIFTSPIKSLKGKSSTSRLFLDEKPKKMSKEWPKLYNDKNFRELMEKNLIHTSFMVTDNYSEYILFVTKYSNQRETGGATLNLKTKEPINQTYIYAGDESIVMLSATKDLHFHAIKENDSGIKIAQFVFNGRGIAFNGTKMKLDGGWKFLCDNNDQTRINLPSQIMVSETKCKKELKWNIYTGFNDDQQFYLFGPKHIHIFPIDAFINVEKSYKCTNRKYSGFFVCKDILDTFALCCIIVLILLFILCICCGVCHYYENKNRKKFPTKSSKKSATKAESSHGKCSKRSKLKSQRSSSNKSNSKKSKSKIQY